MPDLSARQWNSLTDEDVADVVSRDPVVVLPLAATEQHGPHLPITTDIDIGVGLLEIALRALPQDANVWVLPPVRVGASAEHLSFPVTASVSTEELTAAIVRDGASLAERGVKRLVLANSHGGNRHAMEAAGIELRRRHGMLVVKASYFRFDRPDVGLPEAEWRHGLHGGAVETAIMMHLAPEHVKREQLADFPSLGAELAETLVRLGPEGQASFAWLAEDLNPSGVVGDARLATPKLGERLAEHYGRALGDVITDAARFPLERLAVDPSPR